MSKRTYYVISDDNCKFESMTKEEILTAITNAVQTGDFGDIDTGFVTKIKDQNKKVGLKFWVGTQAQYNAQKETMQPNTFCIVTDDHIGDDIFTAIENANQEIENIQKSLEYEEITEGATFGDQYIQLSEEHLPIDFDKYKYLVLYIEKESVAVGKFIQEKVLLTNITKKAWLDSPFNAYGVSCGDYKMTYYDCSQYDVNKLMISEDNPFANTIEPTTGSTISENVTRKVKKIIGYKGESF